MTQEPIISHFVTVCLSPSYWLPFVPILLMNESILHSTIDTFSGIAQVELTSHDGPIVSRTMPQDFGYRDSDSSAPINDSMHQPRRSYDGNMASAIPVKRMMSFGGLDSDSMVGAATPSEVSAVWDAPPSGIEKGRFLRMKD